MAEKKQSTLITLDILKKHADENHPLSAKELIRILRDEYEYFLGKKSDLFEYGNPETGRL